MFKGINKNGRTKALCGSALFHLLKNNNNKLTRYDTKRVSADPIQERVTTNQFPIGNQIIEFVISPDWPTQENLSPLSISLESRLKRELGSLFVFFFSEFFSKQRREERKEKKKMEAAASEHRLEFGSMEYG